VSFQPSIEVDRSAFNLKVTRQEFPVGVAGVRLSLTEIARRIREGARSPSVRAFGEFIVRNAGFPANVTLTHTQYAETFLTYIHNNVRYANDPVLTEFNQIAECTLCTPGAPMCIPVGDCFPEGTLLLRDDFELVPIEKIKVGDRIWGRNKWSTVESKAFKGKLSVDAITMNNGSTIHLTPDHKVYTGFCEHGHRTDCETYACRGLNKRTEVFDRICVRDLKPKDTLLQPERIDFGEKNPDAGRMYIEGLALADGWAQENRFRIAGRDGMRKESQKHEVKAICDRLGIETAWHRRYITVKDAAWAARIAQLGERARFKHLETINLSAKAAAAALRGVMADSTANTNGPGRTFSTTSRVMMTQVRLLHRMHGTSTGLKMLTPEEHGGAGEHPLWRVGVRTIKKQLAVKSISRGVRKVPCWDIQTSDHYVYLPEHDVTVSNCDDLLVAFGSLLMASGVPARIVKQTFNADDQEHVTSQFQLEEGDWVYADPSVKDKPLGWHAPASEEVMIDPNDPAAIGLVGQVPEAEFVGVGRVRRGMGFSAGLLPPGPSQWSPTHPWPWRSIGAAAAPTVDVFAKSATDLATMNTVISAGDSGTSSSNWQGAVSSYQAAGNQGATVIGPEIVNAGAAASGITGPIVQQAVTLNSTLQALNNSTSSSTDATTAQSLVKQMSALYAQAIDAGRATLAGGGGLTFTQKVFIAVAIGAVAGSGWAYYKHSQTHATAALPAKKKARRHPHKRLAARRRR
jgi:hypothetical protein